jgi:hypothetical protein
LHHSDREGLKNSEHAIVKEQIMYGSERILDVIHVGEFPVYEIVEVSKGGDIKLRYVQNPEASITLVRSVIPRLINVLENIK